MTSEATYWNVRDELKDRTLPELQEIVKKDILPFSVCALNVTGDLNLGIMMRTASLMGAERFIIYGKQGYDRRTTIGAQNYINVLKAGSIIRGTEELDYSHFIPLMANYRLSPIFFDTGGTPLADVDMSYYADLTKIFGYTPCLIFGNEGMGIPAELTKGATVVTIPQRGVLRSLNVSAAASIAIHHFSNFLS